MCIYSMVADDWSRRHRDVYEPILSPDSFKVTFPEKAATKADIEELRKELAELKKLLKAAAAYDAATGQPDCEQEEKIALIRKLAEVTGVDMEDCLPKKPEPAPAVKEDLSIQLAKKLEKALLKPNSDVPDICWTTTTGGTAVSDNVSWTTTSGATEGLNKPYDFGTGRPK